MSSWKARNADRRLLLGMLCAATTAVSAQAATQRTRFEIPAQPAGRALVQLGVQAGYSIAFTESAVRRIRAKPVSGLYTPQEALAILLADTGLGFEPVGPASVRIVPRPRPRPAPSQPSRPPALAPPIADTALTEVIVTAQKRAENVQDVPIAITALSQATLERLGADRYETYLALSPGVSFSGVTGNNAISIRGVSTALVGSNQQGTIEVLFDDLPSLNRYFARFNSDLRLVDVERVEVLRGPQGTLFGSGSLGGAVRIINHKPDTGAFAASLQASVSTTKGGEGSYDLKGMLNLPIVEDKLALRLAAYTIRDGGFVDNVVRREDDVNFTESRGVRAILRYEPNDQLSITASAWQQHDRTGGDAVTFLNPANGGEYQSGSVDPEDAIKDRAAFYSMTAEYDLGPVRVLSASSYVRRRGVLDRDYTAYWQGEVQYAGDVEDFVTSRTEMINQELRLTSNDLGKVRWVAGVAYLHQDVSVEFLRTINGLGAAKGYPSDLLSRLVVEPTTEEVAGFGEVNYDLTPRWTITAGARWFRNTLEFSSDRSGYLAGVSTPPRRKTESSVTPKFAALYRLTPEVNLYAQASKGYRTGQNNFIALPDPATGRLPPESYGPDSLWNYELGLKATWLNGRLRTNLAVFDIDWSNIQLTRRLTVTTFTDNAGDATSRGFEAEVVAQPSRWLSAGLAVTYTDARLRAVASGAPVSPGRLPGSPKWTSTAFVQASRPLTGDLEGYVRLDHRFVGAKDAGLETPVDLRAAKSEAYQQLDAQVGVESRRHRLSAYVHNLFDASAATGPRELSHTAPATTRQVPRTIGIEFGAKF